MMDQRPLTAADLVVFTDDDAMPWIAFVWGKADHAKVCDLITLDAIAHETGQDKDFILQTCSWPPRIQEFWIRETEDRFSADYVICKETDAGAALVTGHRFYPQD